MSKPSKKDLKKLSKQELEEFGVQLGIEAGKYIDEACEKANKIFNPYGMQVKVQVVVEKLGTKSKELRS